MVSFNQIIFGLISVLYFCFNLVRTDINSVMPVYQIVKPLWPEKTVFLFSKHSAMIIPTLSVILENIDHVM